MVKWLDFYVEDADFGQRLAGELESKGWQVFEFYQIVHDFPIDAPPDEAGVQIARHYVLRNVAGAYAGLAYTGIASVPVPIDDSGVVDLPLFAEVCRAADTKDFKWYTYMLDGFEWAGQETVFIESADFLQRALDCSSSGGVYQSYIAHIGYKGIESIPEVQLYNTVYKIKDTKTNWWPDSEIHVIGHCTDLHFFILLQYDASPKWTHIHFPYVPLFFGNFVLSSKKKLPHDWNGNVALFTGSCKVEQDEPVTPVGQTFLLNRGDGVASVIVRKNIDGYYYKAHYLEWFRLPETSPPHDNVAYNEYRKAMDNESYQCQFEPNPSRYDGYTQTSPLYIFDQDKGVYGYLPDVVAVSPITGMMNGKKLLAENPCQKSNLGVYQYQIVDALNTPLVKQLDTGEMYPQYVGLGLLRKGTTFHARSDMTM